MTFSLKELFFGEYLNLEDFVISLSNCVADLGMGGVKRKALAKVFQHTKECWIS
jgi:hypothetical protein